MTTEEFKSKSNSDNIDKLIEVWVNRFGIEFCEYFLWKFIIDADRTINRKKFIEEEFLKFKREQKINNILNE